ncbi:hypothetical protein KIN20_009110 [Parelaphostrongylus tenuis]|uniref:Uncharacterized protein n=1 Tax=Parelaphostrongylus tenuis TaxID=148309 RepID=A0AAD5QI23_PARTN|nr:hypothetical protein KIN20_009110 [Parelaphostrongylus tenuis]
MKVYPFLERSVTENGCDACRGSHGAELHTPTLSGSQQQRSMERNSQATFEIAKRVAQPVIYDVQEKGETTNRMLEVLRSLQ